MWVGLQGSGGRLAHARVVLWIAEVPGGSVLPCIQRCYTLHCIYPVRITPDPVKNHEDKHSCVRKENSYPCGLKTSGEMTSFQRAGFTHGEIATCTVYMLEGAGRRDILVFVLLE